MTIAQSILIFFGFSYSCRYSVFSCSCSFRYRRVVNFSMILVFSLGPIGQIIVNEFHADSY